MQLMKQEPLALLRRMASELDRMIEEPWGTFRPGWDVEWEPRAWTPSLELFEKDNTLVARFDLPGMKKEDVHVEVSEGYLLVRGERRYAKEEKKENVYRSGREYGRFYRSIPLPEGAGIDNVQASITDGVLEVTVPFTVKAAPPVRKVEVIEATAKAAKAA